MMYRMARLLSTLPVRKDMEQLLNYYLNNMLMSTSVGGYETQLSLRSTFNFGICSCILGYVLCMLIFLGNSIKSNISVKCAMYI